jgi:hypothetical protein
VTDSTIANFKFSDVRKKHGYVLDIVGFYGARTAVNQTVQLSFIIGECEVEYHEFAVVSDDVLPHCMLLGLNFLTRHNMNITFIKLTPVIRMHCTGAIDPSKYLTDV